MNKQEFLCLNCGNEAMIETFAVDIELEFCPICGASKYDHMPEDDYEEDDD